ncbi:carbamate kinase [Streptococcus pyogenes]|uniref:carbamate kinase n=1 Tax=Streptococcus pyogenes TaxID=1314 RepID=UPI0007C2F683|nr:carbamate kinase [Streptococcus pyogenes]OAC52002.1 carbamate kinase [Streptococcus pyogenes]OAC59903.1 carbamate kinase [Streptococcus pyogenes]OAC66406.1 carbamate kinase [Streptococcus pyogenes]OAC71395.1 carbamate kinase [Streptococcus pyogenes]OAC75062.1 carbamate kinase [Streptococcus pyogenes]
MTKQKIVVALGGNAILSTDASAKAQQEALISTSKSLVKLIKEGHEVIVTHGNGPQVGNLLLQQAAADSEKNPAMPLDTCVAMTEGSIGFWLVNALDNELQAQGIQKEVAAVVTQVIVDAKDPAFENPTKPIGPFLTEEDAKKQMVESGASFKEDAGRGWRKVVPSPKPVGIKEANVIRSLVDSGVVVVSAGGGGVPVVEDATSKTLTGVEAVIDKDFASQTLSELVDADLFIVLTGVDNVYVNFNKPDQAKLEEVTVSQMKEYITQDQFAPGSMLPKVEAAIAFVENKPNAKAIITSLENIDNVLSANAGTQIIAG